MGALITHQRSEKRMEMSISNRLTLTITIFLLAISIATSHDQPIDKFLDCLPQHSNASIPILDFIYRPNNSSFVPVLQAYIKNRRFLSPDTPKPLAIVTAKDVSHVQATVVCAKSVGLQVRIRSGGHDYEGLSYTSTVPFVVLDMFNLRQINIDLDEGVAWVEAGATLGELYYKIGNRSKVHAFPAGVCTTLGTGGHFSGGGYGNLMRKYGLSIDNIIDAQLVNANGQLLNRKSMGKDLFWAIRGGGGGSFGVIIAWKIKLVKVPEIVSVFKVHRTLEQGATDIVYRWQQVASQLDRKLYIRAMPRVYSGTREGEKTINVSFIGMFLGNTKKLVPLMKKNFPELGFQKCNSQEMSWLESLVFWADFPTGTPTTALLNRPKQPFVNFKSKSDFVNEIIPKSGLKKIWKWMIKVDKFWMQWNPLGGRMSEISADATPYPHRSGYLFKIQHFALWQEDDIQTRNKYMSLIREFYKNIAPYVTKKPREAFLNYRDLDIGSNHSNATNFSTAQTYGQKYFKDNFERLVAVKKQVDPFNFFKNEQSIPVSLEKKKVT